MPWSNHFVTRLIFLLLFTICVSLSTRAVSATGAINGVLDLRQADLQNLSVKLEGQWRFLFGKLIVTMAEMQNQGDETLRVPSSWKGQLYRGQELAGTGFASFGLKVILPASQVGKVFSLASNICDTAFTVFLNGRKILSNGKVGITEKTSEPEWRPVTATFEVRQAELEFVVQVSNFHHARGGFSNPMTLGLAEIIQREQTRSVALELFLAGSIFIMCIYHLGLYFLRRKNIAVLFFAIVCLLTTIRILVTGNFYLAQLIPSLPFWLQVKLEYLSFYMNFPFFFLFFARLFPDEFSAWVKKLVLIICAPFILIVMAAPSLFFSETLMYYQLIIFILALYLFYPIILAARHKKSGAVALLLGMIVILLAFVNDALSNAKVIQTPFIFPVGLFVFFFSQAFLLSQNFSNAFNSVERLTISLEKTNQAYSRFVPMEFLRFLNKKDITDIELGDQVEKRMTVMFTDIRSFTDLSEQMTPEENFNFLNSYLKRMYPIVQNHHGFIDKYIGDAVMALFPQGAEDAILAAIAMQREIRVYNEYRRNKNYREITVGIGLHTGNLMLGTIGAKERLQGTVISDAVNLASRIEELTKKFACEILISQTTFDDLDNRRNYNIVPLEEVQVKGKSKMIMVYKVVVE